jgi:hypothetical protein
VIELEFGILVYPPEAEGEPWRAVFTENGQRRFRPAQFADFRALSGDASDNIPGVRGIGAKTAAALLPAPAKVIGQFGLWRRSVPAAQGSSVPA